MEQIALMTDFGQQDGYVGIMKGVIASIAPEANVIDLTHDLPPQNLDAAKFVLWNCYRHFPEGTIFVCVVDPGVGSQRHILAFHIGKYIFIAPDNGVLDYVMAENRTKHLLRVQESRVMASSISNTFHGRDIFAPAAAHIAAGFPFTMIGPMHPYTLPQSPFVHPKGNSTPGKILHVDHFGNLISNIYLKPQDAQGMVQVGDRKIPVEQTYAAVSEGELLALPGSHGLLEIAVRNGNAHTALSAGVGAELMFAPHGI